MAFGGEVVTETLAAVLKNDPDWSLLPAATPMRVRVLLQRCLQKDPKQRLRDIGDARIALDEVIAGAPDTAGVAPRHSRSEGIALDVARLRCRGPLHPRHGLLGVSLYFRQSHTAAPVQAVRFEVPLPDKTTFTGGAAPSLSPDGRKLAFIATGADALSHLWSGRSIRSNSGPWTARKVQLAAVLVPG